MTTPSSTAEGEMSAEDAFAQAFPQLYRRIKDNCPRADWNGLWANVQIGGSMTVSLLAGNVNLLFPVDSCT